MRMEADGVPLPPSTHAESIAASSLSACSTPPLRSGTKDSSTSERLGKMTSVESSPTSSCSSSIGGMMTTGQGKDSANRKVVHNASSKVSLVVQRMLLPIIQTPLRSHVVFDVEEDQVELDLIEQMGKKNPDVLEDATGLTFIQHLQGVFHRYRWWQSPSGAYSRVAVCPSSRARAEMDLCER